MRKVERRATICLLLAAVLFLGTGVFVWRFVTQGKTWASFSGNLQIDTPLDATLSPVMSAVQGIASWK